LAEDIIKKEKQILEFMTEIQSLLKEGPKP
jgi:hypothetical protein